MAIETPEQTLARISQTINDSVKRAFSPKFTNKLGKKASLQIIKRVRLGYGVADTGNQKRLKKLADSYKKVRKGKLKFYTGTRKDGSRFIGTYKPKGAPRLSNQTTPGRSNLTATGKMLQSIRGYGRKQKIIVEIPDKPHGPDIFGNPVSLSHAELARVHQNGATIRHPSGTIIKIPKRRFFEFTNAEQKGLIREVRQFILKLTKSKLG